MQDSPCRGFIQICSQSVSTSPYDKDYQQRMEASMFAAYCKPSASTPQVSHCLSAAVSTQWRTNTHRNYAG